MWIAAKIAVCLAAGWLLAQLVPVRSDSRSSDSSEHANQMPGGAAGNRSSAAKPLGASDLDARALLYAGDQRGAVAPGERIALKYAQWAERDPRGAIGAAFQHLPDTERLYSVDAALLVVAEKDVRVALELALPHFEALVENGGGGWVATGAVRTIFRPYIEQDFAAARAAIETLPAFMFEGEGTGLGGSLFPDGYMPASPKLALVAAEELVKRWPEDQFAAKVRWAAELFGEDGGDWYEFSSLVDAPHARWKQEIAAAVVGEVSGIEDAASRDLALLLAIRRSPEEIGERAVTLLSTENRGSGWASLALRIEDRLEAIALVGEHWDEIGSGSGFLSATSLEELLHQLDPAAGSFSKTHVPTGLLLELPEAAQRLLLRSVTGQVTDAPTDPFGGLELPDDWVPPDALLVQLDALPAGEVKNRAMAELTENWAAANPSAASEWITTLLGGTAHRDAVVGALVRTIAEEDPEAATEWAEAIADPAQRERHLRVALRHWSAVQPQTAAEAIRSSQLSEAAARSLLERLDPSEP